MGLNIIIDLSDLSEKNLSSSNLFLKMISKDDKINCYISKSKMKFKTSFRKLIKLVKQIKIRLNYDLKIFYLKFSKLLRHKFQTCYNIMGIYSKLCLVLDLSNNLKLISLTKMLKLCSKTYLQYL